MDSKDLEQGFGDVYPGVSFMVLNTLSSLLLYGVMGLFIYSFIQKTVKYLWHVMYCARS